MSQRWCPAWERCLRHWQQLGVSGRLMDACPWSRAKGSDLLFFSMPGGNTMSCRFSRASTSSFCLQGVVLGCYCIRGGMWGCM